MDAVTLLDRARAAGLAVEADGDRLVVRRPKSAEPLVRELTKHKAELLALLWDGEGEQRRPFPWRGRPQGPAAVAEAVDYCLRRRLLSQAEPMGLAALRLLQRRGLRRAAGRT